MKMKRRVERHTSQHRSGKIYPSLPTIEISLYVIICIMSASHSLHSITKVGMEKLEAGSLKYGVDKIDPWWRFWTSEEIFRDHSDYEWEIWKKISIEGIE